MYCWLGYCLVLDLGTSDKGIRVGKEPVKKNNNKQNKQGTCPECCKIYNVMIKRCFIHITYSFHNDWYGQLWDIRFKFHSFNIFLDFGFWKPTAFRHFFSNFPSRHHQMRAFLLVSFVSHFASTFVMFQVLCEKYLRL